MMSRTTTVMSSSDGNCGHWIVRHRICLTCKKKVSHLEEDRAFNYLFSGLCLTNEAMPFTKRLVTLITIYDHKKLHLVLDLDHTLINSVSVSNLSQAEKYLIDEERSGKWENLGKYEDRLIKSRPFLQEFLEEASKLFNMHVYTKGSSGYAQAVVKMIDPNKTYFGGRVISRRESPYNKTLDLVLADERGTVIVDDTVEVWPHHQKNLLQIRRYLYFKHDCINKKSYAERRRDESRSSKGGLANVLKFLKLVHNGFFSCGVGEDLESKDVRSLINGPFKLYGC
ncbi:unnamed protein product [Microthlaspi erraticum]|uniref:RNA polymerase II C-terminal domain phosphatase-like n=1 Tax=Microthlaspi erraticum TaxID=1685480 RepID=A0A6D2HGQ3_9BRAS|nr:unnamed protein product [Microthlaspi erraticum]